MEVGIISKCKLGQSLRKESKTAVSLGYDLRRVCRTIGIRFKESVDSGENSIEESRKDDGDQI